MSKILDWRKHLPVHPAAELFPLMAEAELKELAADIKANGLRSPIVMWTADHNTKSVLIDGRNRLDALALLGALEPGEKYGVRIKRKGSGWDHDDDQLFDDLWGTDGDPYAIALSLNAHRRHLTPEQKRDLIAKLLKATPEKSNRQIAETAKASHHTVVAVRTEQEATGQIAQLAKTTGKDGRTRTAKPKPHKTAPELMVEALVDEGTPKAVAKRRVREELAEGLSTDAGPTIKEQRENAVRQAFVAAVGDILKLMKLMTKPASHYSDIVPAADVAMAANFLNQIATAERAAAPNGHPAAVPISDEEAFAETWSRKDEPSRTTQAKAGRP